MPLFVVQEHHARHLHWDFRLEIGGVLKSWALPRGPSLNPADKRLAVQTPDHDLEYAGYEGIIPEGYYGAGPVLVWDSGTFKPVHPQNSEQGLRDGVFSFYLDGILLGGLFTLVRLKKSDENAWLLIKRQDRFARSDWKMRELLTPKRLRQLPLRAPGSNISEEVERKVASRIIRDAA